MDRFCRKNFQHKAEWTEIDFSLCSPKTEITKKLLSLNQVSESLEDLPHCCNFFKNEPKTAFQLWKRKEYSKLQRIN